MATDVVTSGTATAPYMPLTVQALDCPGPILHEDFDRCRIPGGPEFWENGGFYSPGMCFEGYTAGCTEAKTFNNGFPVRRGETAVKCVPE